jgi:NADPH-dependent 2,4-dienoyl-CoA reductase/sulfur reductase-like enzyme
MSARSDVLVIGAGPAGMSAALAAATHGASVVVVDDNPLPGGQIWRDGPQARLPAQARAVRQRMLDHPDIRYLPGTRVIAQAGPRQLLLENAENGWVQTYAALILCTGARELLLPFPGWTLPGVTGAGGLQALIKGGLPVRDERLVIAGSGPLLLATAATAAGQGAHILRIAEQASARALAGFIAQLPRWPRKLGQSLNLGNRHYRTGAHVVEAFGDDRLQGVRLKQQGRVVEIACDRLACGFGLVANSQLGQALGYELKAGGLQVDAWQQACLPDHYAAGECTGPGGNELAQVEGSIAGHAAAGDRRGAERLWPRRAYWQDFADAVNAAFALDPALKTLARADTLVCRCEDVALGDLIEHASWREAKLASRCGMGACQGRICGAATLHLLGWPTDAARPPFTPARIETLLQVDTDPPVERAV